MSPSPLSPQQALSPLHPVHRLRRNGLVLGDRHPLNFLRARLSQRIALSVFSSIIAIEVIILIPSVIRHQDKLLIHLSDQSSASLAGALINLPESPAPTAQQLLERLTPLQRLPFIAGGSVYRRRGPDAGAMVGQFGEAPQLHYDPLVGMERGRLRWGDRRYDSAWTSLLLNDYLVIISHDTSGLGSAIAAFVGRISVLILLIASVVIFTTMIVLRPLLITPILTLKNDLLRAAPAALRADGAVAIPFDSLRYRHADEIGDVIVAFEQMFDHIASTVAQRQQAEAKLSESERRFRSLVQQAAESIFVVDHNGTIANINIFALEALNYTRQELLHQSIFEIMPHLTPELYRQQWQALHQGEPITFEATYRRKHGQTYPAEVRSSLIQQDGKIYMLKLARDISDRKQAEAVQTRLAEIGELAAMIVHEVRNPLATIYMALTGFGKLNLPLTGQLRLKLALEEAERLKRLLNEILTYSREPRLKGECVEINGLCQELDQQLRALPMAQGRAIRLTPFSQMLVVSGDRDKLKQVLINLVTNACEAISAGEAVHWRIQRIPKQIKIWVQNGGDPIPSDVLPKLTQPFVSTKEGGNGLGLAITKRIVEAHGGSLTLTSNKAEGTVATVLLPLLAPEMGPDGGR